MRKMHSDLRRLAVDRALTWGVRLVGEDNVSLVDCCPYICRPSQSKGYFQRQEFPALTDVLKIPSLPTPMHTTALTQGVDPELDSTRKPMRPTFYVACWLLALVAFLQLLSVGTALTVRYGTPLNSQIATKTAIPGADDPIQPRSIEQILADVGSPGGSGITLDAAAHQPVLVRPSAPPVDHSPPTPHVSEPYTKTGISIPRVERLVMESRNLHLEGDMMRAMLKLDEAARIDPSECAVIYERGILFESMGSYRRAADQFQQIQQMGLVKAGEYFNLAARKLTKGMDTASVRRSTLGIGPVKTNKTTETTTDKKVEVAITLFGRPDLEIQSDDVEVQVHFYDKVNGGEIKKAAANAQITPYWADSKVDWQDAGNEETLRVGYSIPITDPTDAHLFGRREFFGCVVQLLYKGEVIDEKAQPRLLHSVHAQKYAPSYQDEYGMPWLPGEDDSLLPDKNQDYNSSATLPNR